MFSGLNESAQNHQNSFLNQKDSPQVPIEEPTAQTSSADIDMSFSPPRKESTTPFASPAKTLFAIPQSSETPKSNSIFGVMNATNTTSSLFSNPITTTNLFSKASDSAGTVSSPFDAAPRPAFSSTTSAEPNPLPSLNSEKGSLSVEHKHNKAEISQALESRNQEKTASIPDWVAQDKEGRAFSEHATLVPNPTPNTFQAVSDATASKRQPFDPVSSLVPNSADSTHSLSSIATTKAASSGDRVSAAMPPSVPNRFSEDQARQYVTVYRLTSLDHGLKNHVIKATSFSGDSEVMRFHEARRREILKAGGFPAMIHGLRANRNRSGNSNAPNQSPVEDTHSARGKGVSQASNYFPQTNNKRKADEEIEKEHQNGAMSGSPKKPRPDSVSVPQPNNKRKADEEIGKDSDSAGNITSPKRARPEAVSYPALPASSSQTASLFASIANGTTAISKSTTATPSSSAPSGTNHASQDSMKNTTSQLVPQPSVQTKVQTASPFNFKPVTKNHQAPAISVPSLSTAKPLPAPQSSSGLFNIQPSTSSGHDKATSTPNMFSFKPAASGDSQPNQAASSPTKVTNGSASIVSAVTTSSEKSAAERTERPVFQVPTSVSSSNTRTQMPKLNPPRFGPVSAEAFKSQFGQLAQKNAEEEKRARKEADYNSDEETEAEWEARDAEAQRLKLDKTHEITKNQSLQFSIGSGSGAAAGTKPASTLFPTTSQTPALTAGHSAASATPAVSTTSSRPLSANLEPANSQSQTGSIFGALSRSESEVTHGNTGDANNGEGSASGGDSQKTPTPIQSTGRSMFDRVEQNEDGSLKRANVEEKEASKTSLGDSAQPKTSLFQTSSSTQGHSIFSQSSTSKDAKSNPFAQLAKPASSNSADQAPGPLKSSSLFNLSTSGDKPFSALKSSSTAPSVEDQTWKPGKPITFGKVGPASTDGTSATSPSKAPLTDQKPTPFINLFGASPQASASIPSKPTSTLFGTATTNMPAANAGFSFGGPPKPATNNNNLSATSVLTSGVTSRATSPGATSTGGESANESTAEEEAPKDEQISLATARAGEEDEDILFEVRAKAREFAVDETAEKKGEMSWRVRGLGSLRVLKHRQTKKTRMVMRQDPSGKVVLNAALMETVEYKNRPAKTVSFGAATGSGKMSNWTITVKDNDDAKRLANILESNKSN